MNKSQSETLALSKFRLISGLIFGLLYAISFYSLLFMTRESLRIISITHANDIWVLTDKQVGFYNLFFAYLASIVGQSICFTIWFDAPHYGYGRNGYRINSIVNDQRNLIWYFLSWFSKLAFIFVLLVGMVYQRGFNLFSFHPEYNFLFIFIIIVLFFQSWNTIRVTFIRQSKRWIIMALIIVSGLSIGLSKINLIDYKAINKMVLSKNIHTNYTLQLPESMIYEPAVKQSLMEDINVVFDKNDSINPTPKIIIDSEEITLTELPKKVQEWQEKRHSVAIPFMIYRLYIHGEVKMAFIGRLKTVLKACGGNQIGYAVIPANYNYGHRPYPKEYIAVPLSSQITQLTIPAVPPTAHQYTAITINLHSKGDMLVNEVLLHEQDHKSYIRSTIEKNPNYRFICHIDPNTPYRLYLRNYIQLKEIITALRNEYAMEKYGKKYDSLDWEDSKSVKRIYPFAYREIIDQSSE
ncbi:hypothetical protein EYV94_16250 [Puteibacter caeruleilacunae]|nr:hypothetical protein EYV94_16250 [Puteibacter caeruleilacunae]